MKRSDIALFKKWLTEKESASRAELELYLRQNEMVRSLDLSPAIKQLVDAGVCFEQRDGLYCSMGKRIQYRFRECDPLLHSVLSKLQIPVILCPVSSYELNRFLSLQVFSARHIVYAPKIVHDELASLLSTNGYLPLVLRKRDTPYTNDKTVFLSGLHWRTPVDRNGKRLSSTRREPLICGTTIEKLLVDSLAGDFGIDESMVEELFRNATSAYAYNISTIKRYAKDRSKEEQLFNVITKCGLEKEFYD